MMTTSDKRAGFTPGPVTVHLLGKRGTFFIPEARDHEANAAKFDGVDGYTVSSANAALIADAFNVAHETGMTPRELAAKLEKSEASFSAMAESNAINAKRSADAQEKLADVTAQRDELLARIAELEKALLEAIQFVEAHCGWATAEDGVVHAVMVRESPNCPSAKFDLDAARTALAANTSTEK